MAGNLVLILGDQLSLNISALKNFDKNHDAILMVEARDETQYAPHHPQKIILILSAMRQFAELLRHDGYQVFYSKLDDDKNLGSFDKELMRFHSQINAQKIIITEPSEYRVLKLFNDLAQNNNLDIEIRDDDRFICSHHEFANYAKGKKNLLMENFYHLMRVKTKILMNEEVQKSSTKNTSKSIFKPVGGKWNYDKENRGTMPNNIRPPKILQLEKSPITAKIIAEIIDLVKQKFANNFGAVENFNYATNRAQALIHFDDFLKNLSLCSSNINKFWRLMTS